jgi:hypothetical protein
MPRLITKEHENVYDEVESIPIEQLRDLWIVRYGNAWVADNGMDLFYAATAIRLYYLGKMDKSTPPTSWNAVYRIKEE